CFHVCVLCHKKYIFYYNTLINISSMVAIVTQNSTDVKLACYILIGVGTFPILISFFGCLGAIYEVRSLLSLYFSVILLILITQFAAGALIYFQKDVVSDGISNIVLDKYSGNSSITEQAWDFIQTNMECCGWIDRTDWSGNMVIVNSSQLLFPCSCQNISLISGNFSDSGFCEAKTPDWPVYDVGCAASVERWLLTNIGVVLGICLGVTLLELLGMILSICLCRNVHMEDYTKVPKY
uniref:Tetraspanin n=1 Tax=Pundamilia nyererei TaxID=303518 RepID=A0A3B4EZ34_9CICH